MTELPQQIIKTFDCIAIALMVAFLAISARLNFALGPVPITLQTLVIILSGILINPSQSWMVAVIYLIMGLVGFPFFANGGGISYLFKPSFGFLLGFIPATLITGVVYRFKFLKSEYFRVIGGAVLGITVIYLCGLGYIPFAAIFFGSRLAVWALIIPTLPLMIIGDVCKIMLLTALVPPLKKEFEYIRRTLQG